MERELGQRLELIKAQLGDLEKLELELRRTAAQIDEQRHRVDEECLRLSTELDHLSAALDSLRAQSLSSDAEEFVLDDAGIRVALRVAWSGGLPSLSVRMASANAPTPMEGILLAVLGRGEQVLATATTDVSGAATLELAEGVRRLRLQFPDKQGAWDIDLSLDN